MTTTIAWLALGAHVAVGIFAWRRGSAMPLVPMLNLAFALCVAFYWGQRLLMALSKGLTWYATDQVWLVYALAVCAVSILTLTGRITWNGLHWTLFGAHTLVYAAAALFFTFFRINRLF